MPRKAPFGVGMPLEPEDQKHLEAAHGYVELGMFLDANEALEYIDSEVRHLPEVLEVRLKIYQSLQKWGLMQAVAKHLVEHQDDVQSWISWAYATRRNESIPAAQMILLGAAKKHPEEPLIHYNLACCQCQLEDFASAKKCLELAFKLDPDLRLRALDDEDLMPLWLAIEKS